MKTLLPSTSSMDIRTIPEGSNPFVDSSINPFDDDSAIGGDVSTVSTISRPTMSKHENDRQQLYSIQETYKENMNQKEDDMETGLYPPSSDYASVVPQSILESGDPRNSRNYFDSRKTRKNNLLLILGVIALALIGAIVAIASLAFTGSSDGSSTLSDTSDAQIQITMSAKLSEIVSMISNEDALRNPKSPQYLARNWLIFQDGFYADTNVSDVSQHRVVQRYVLAVFYFATGGNTIWLGTNWLNGDECNEMWDHISCNEIGEVRAISCGTFN